MKPPQEWSREFTGGQYTKLIAMVQADARAELEALLGAAWEAGAAHAIGSHECFKQTHPSKEEWLAIHAPKEQP